MCAHRYIILVDGHVDFPVVLSILNGSVDHDDFPGRKIIDIQRYDSLLIHQSFRFFILFITSGKIPDLCIGKLHTYTPAFILLLYHLFHVICPCI